MKKRIAIWTPGGVGAGLHAQGFPFIVRLLERLTEFYEIDVYTLSAPASDFNPKGYQIFFTRYWKSTTLIVGYLGFVFKRNHFVKRYDLIFSFWGYPTGFVVVLLGKLLRISSVVNLLGGESANLPEIKYGVLHKFWPRKLLFWTINHATELLALTKYQTDILTKYGLRREVTLIPWGPDVELFHDTPKVNQDCINIIHVANLTPVKDQETLIRTFDIIRKAREAKLRIIGPDFMNGTLQRLVQEFKLQNDVAFLGSIPYEKMNAHYQWAHIIILTSLSEGQNNSMLEAARCGVLMAGTKVGILYHLGEEYSIISNIGDYKTLASKILNVLNDADAMNQKIEKSKQWSERHDFNWAVQQYHILIKSAIQLKA